MNPRIPDGKPPRLPRVDLPRIPTPPKTAGDSGPGGLGGLAEQFAAAGANPFRQAAAGAAALTGVGLGGLPAPAEMMEAFFAGARRGAANAVARLLPAGFAETFGPDAAANVARRVVDGLPKAMADVFERAGATARTAGDRAREMLSWVTQQAGSAGATGDALLTFLGGQAQLVPEFVQSIGGKVTPSLERILADPAAFLANLGRAMLSGVTQFAGNVKTHLVGGLRDWLMNAMPDELRQALPEKFDVKGLAGFALKLLGMTAERVFERLDRLVGPGVRQAVERAFDGAARVATDGPAAAWEMTKGVVSNLKEHVFEALSDTPAAEVAEWMLQKGGGAAVRATDFVASASDRAWDAASSHVAETAERMKSFVGSLFGGN